MRLLRSIRELTGGQVPPITRRATIAVGILFIISLIIFKPQAKVYPRAQSLAQPVQLLPAGSALAENESLMDSSIIYLPPATTQRRVIPSTDSMQMEDAPLPGFGPQFRFSPTRPLDLSLETEKSQAPSAYQAIPLKDTQPFASMGSANLSQSSMEPRVGLYEVYPVSGANKPVLNGKLPSKISFTGKNPIKNSKNSPLLLNLELLIGLDSMGMQSQARLLQSSGDVEVDNAVKEWSSSMDWGRLLAPGFYRLVIGP
jgi:hypothetical protein